MSSQALTSGNKLESQASPWKHSVSPSSRFRPDIAPNRPCLVVDHMYLHLSATLVAVVSHVVFPCAHLCLWTDRQDTGVRVAGFVSMSYLFIVGYRSWRFWSLWVFRYYINSISLRMARRSYASNLMDGSSAPVEFVRVKVSVYATHFRQLLGRLEDSQNGVDNLHLSKRTSSSRIKHG